MTTKNNKNFGYRIDFITNTITITKSFAQKIQNPNSAEYKMLRKIKKDYPYFEIISASQKARKKKSSNLTSNDSSNDKKTIGRISYSKMEKYISCQPDATLLLEVFSNVRELSKGQPYPYNYVFDWFKRTFPHYNELPKFDDNGDLIPQYKLSAIIKSNPKAQTAETTQDKITLEEELSHAA